jgi:primosomal protein N' (replication factor Y)
LYAEVIVNIEAPLEGTFHYHLPPELAPILQVGHLVEVEFGTRRAQAIIVAFTEAAAVEETKPVLGLVDAQPVVRPEQIELARWIGRRYLAPSNASLRLMLPPGLTRWADTRIEISPEWDGTGRLTAAQQAVVDAVRRRGMLRGRQLGRALPRGAEWPNVVRQLTARGILTRTSVLDPPRIRPKVIRTAELIAGPARIREAAGKLGRHSKAAAVLFYLLTSPDPLPAEDAVLAASDASARQLNELVEAGLVQRAAAAELLVPADGNGSPTAAEAGLLAELPAPADALPEAAAAALEKRGLIGRLAQPAAVSLAVPPRKALEHLYSLRRAGTYLDVLDYLARAAGPAALTELYAATGANLSHLRRLEKLDLIRFGETEVWRDPLADRYFTPADAPRLTADQARVWGRVKVAMLSLMDGEPDEGEAGSEDRGLAAAARPLPVLLHGVTGSGKTEIYLRAVELALEHGRQAIVLVPEIALTPQTIRRFAARFPGQVAVLHSELTEGERFDTWRRARQGDVDIVIGPRSALFTPLPRLGVIVIDEEHDGSYRQTPPVPGPYYHTRDVTLKLGELSSALVIMGSATPDIVTYHHARAGRYQLLELPQRIMGHRQRIASQAAQIQRPPQYRQDEADPDEALHISLPPIQVVDLRHELRVGNRSIFSRALRQAIDETLSRREQVILFLNRRGSHSFVMCRDCGLVLKCPRCDMPLTFHRADAKLACHFCGREEPAHERCPRCRSNRIRYFGLGTEEIERLMLEEWPAARTVRWDRDTTSGRDRHDALLTSFINHEADVLIGTQMIAKGLDLPLVTLVGVISADVSLGLPDFRMGERTFQVLAQVAGRAGRGLLGGRVIIQTYQPEHYAIRAAAAHDYITFYLEEIRFRTQHHLPPFRRLARLLISDPVNARAESAARELAATLRQHIRREQLGATELLGPVPPFFHRVDGRFRWQILVRSPNPARMLESLRLPPGWLVEIDPLDTL